MILNFFVYLMLIKNLVFANMCMEFNASLTQIVERKGFKREIKWLMEIHSPETGECEFVMRFVASSGLFVNPNELADLQRHGQLSAKVVGDVNIEAPEHASDEHVVYIYISKADSERKSVTLPIYLRYQKAQIAGGFGKVVLSKPSLLAHIPGESKECKKYPRVKWPANEMGFDGRIWRNITYQAFFENVELFVPIGDLDDYPLVAIVTLLLGCCGCIYILSVLSTAPL